MKRLTKKEVIKQIEKVSKMDPKTAEAHRAKVSVSNIDDKAKNFIYDAIDVMVKVVDPGSALIEHSEVKPGEM